MNDFKQFISELTEATDRLNKLLINHEAPYLVKSTSMDDTIEIMVKYFQLKRVNRVTKEMLAVERVVSAHSNVNNSWVGDWVRNLISNASRG